MGKEAKIGVAVILGLLVVLGIVVGVRVASFGGGDDPGGPPDTAKEKPPVPVDRGVAVSPTPPLKSSKPASKPIPPSPPKKPDETKKPPLVTPEYPESPDSPTAQWRRLAVADAESAPAGIMEVSEGSSHMPPPRAPSEQAPNDRYGNIYGRPMPPDSSAGYASADGSPGSVRSYDPSRPGRFDTSTQGSPYGYANRNSTPPPATRPPYMPPGGAGIGSAAGMPPGGIRGLPYSDPGDGRRGDGTYEVQPNDSFWTISEKLYGTGAYFQALAEFNRDKVPNRNQMQVGQLIAAPDVAELEQKHPALCPKPEHRYVARHQTTISPVGQYGNAATYTVAEGDSLYRIARYELGDASRWHEIYKLNRDVIGESFNHLRPGTQLVLPNTVSPETPDPADTLTRRPSSLY